MRQGAEPKNEQGFTEQDPDVARKHAQQRGDLAARRGARPAFVALSDRVWEMPELNFQEVRSAASTPRCCAPGIRVTEGTGGIPTAMMGEAGEGGPVIAILGEYDALRA